MQIAPSTDTRSLVKELERAIGEHNVAFDDVTRAIYSTDASNYQIIPVGVAFPRDGDDVCAVHEIATAHQLPLLPRGGGTSLAGQTVGHAIVMDFTRHMRRFRSVNAEQRTVVVEPGMVLDQLNQQLGKLGLKYGPDPASGNRATVGGALGNNSTGTHSILYGMSSDHVRWVDVVLASGEKVRLGPPELTPQNQTTQRIATNIRQILQQHESQIVERYPKTWRTVAGYALNRLDVDALDLAQLVVGSEGTLGTIVAAELNVVEKPRHTCLAVVHFSDYMASLEAVPTILETEPSAVELLDKFLMDRTRRQPEFAKHLTFVEGDPAALLLVEFYGASEAELDAGLARLRHVLQRIGHREPVVVLTTSHDQANVWKIRKSGLGLLYSERSEFKTIPVIEDAAVPVEHLAAYIERVEQVVHDAGAEMAIYAHASAGCLHVRPMLNLKNERGLRQYREIAEGAVAAVMAFGGTTSGEHGEGILRGEFSKVLFGEDLTQAFREVKRAFDPDNLMNPGKVVDVPPMDDSHLLRFGTDYSVPLELVETRFDWQADNGFAAAVEMCNGSGVCRKEDSGTMCPSFMATRDEKDSTRGRANVLRLAMSGKLGLDAMQQERVKDVLDLCLSCKACKAECPSAVDMARIKAEFMANYHDAHGVSIRDQIFGNIHRLNRIGGWVPWLANMGLQVPGVAALTKQLLQVASDRDLPRFASTRFSQWWKQQPNPESHTSTARSVPILIIDTFAEYYEPEIGQALAFIAQQIGIGLRAVRMPGQACCGRPAMSKGLLDTARDMATANLQYLKRIVATEPNARFMIFEPSCLSAFVDDYPTLVDADWQPWAADIAERFMSIEQWLAELATEGLLQSLNWDLLPRQVILHGHCHQKALWGTQATLTALQAIPGATVTELDAGCCGMAGSFGYAAEHYDVSMQIAEQRLYPAVRDNPDALIAAPGTSCREQVAHIQGRVFHPVEIVAMACGWQSS